MQRIIPLFVLLFTTLPSLAVQVVPTGAQPPLSSSYDGDDEDGDGGLDGSDEGEPEYKKSKKRHEYSKKSADRKKIVFEKVAELLGELSGDTPQGHFLHSKVADRIDELNGVSAIFKAIRNIGSIAGLYPEYNNMIARGNPNNVNHILQVIMEVVRQRVIQRTLDDAGQSPSVLQDNNGPEERLVIPEEDLQRAKEALAQIAEQPNFNFDDWESDLSQLKNVPSFSEFPWSDN